MKNNIKAGTDKEKWINEVMASTNGMQPAMPPSYFFEKITKGISSPRKGKVIAFPVKQWAAAAVLLLSINIGSAIYSIEHKRKTGNIASSVPIAVEMQLESTYNY